MNTIITIERTVDNTQERLVELTRTATGDGWIFQCGGFSTQWRDAGFYTARYFSEWEEANLTGAADALAEIDPQAANWEYTVVLVDSIAYQCQYTTVVKPDSTRVRWAEPQRGDDFYRAYWPQGTLEELARDAEDKYWFEEVSREHHEWHQAMMVDGEECDFLEWLERKGFPADVIAAEKERAERNLRRGWIDTHLCVGRTAWNKRDEKKCKWLGD